MTTIETKTDSVDRLYKHFADVTEGFRKRFGRPLSLAEKILFAHLDETQAMESGLERGQSYLALHPDRLAMQDATAQMALLQFITAGRQRVALPTTVHCDHLIQAYAGASADTERAVSENQEVYSFLRTVSQRYGIGFWKPGSGIIHQVVLENYAFPGGLMIGTDSHTPNAGGMGMLAIGVGGADAVDVMVGMPWEVKFPEIIGVHLKGSLSGWTSPKDVILRVCEMLTTKGGTDKIAEYFGSGTNAISATGKATITNMGAELGATTSVFPFDSRTSTYLRATGRDRIAELAESYQDFLQADVEVMEDPARYYDQIIEIDLDTLEPYVVGPHSPDVAHPISRLADDAKENGYPTEIKVALIGSCTNSSYEDIGRAAHVAQQAVERGVTSQSQFMITPGSEQIYETISRDGQLEVLGQVGGQVLANACGPCIGMWRREDTKGEDPNTIVTSFNRNFPKRNDGRPSTLAFIGSPEIVTALGLAGRLDFNPLTDTLRDSEGNEFRLSPPEAPELPAKGFVSDNKGFIAAVEDGAEVAIEVSPESERLQLLEPFPKWNGQDISNAVVLVKAKGKCTTDHISPAGPWLRFRGHLDRISDNMFSGAINAFTNESGKGQDVLTGDQGVAFSELARRYQQAGVPWISVGDTNYGEGSSREHAAMEPRFLGAAAVITRSFARIHETNLKKQGVLPLTFSDPADYENIRADDRLDIVGLEHIIPDKTIQMTVRHADGTTEDILLNHSLTTEQIDWFRAGSALNLLRQKG